MKRILAAADLHSGHVAGLTPPRWEKTAAAEGDKMYLQRRSIWNWYEQMVKSLQPIDGIIVVGDCIQGYSEKWVRELLYIDRIEQCHMAAEAIRVAGDAPLYMVYGTPFHTGVTEQWENLVANEAGATKIGAVDDLVVEGNTINYKHCVGRSDVPHGRYTAIARERLWNVEWFNRGEYPKADILLRAHVHYHAFAGNVDFLGIVLPALQGYGGSYGLSHPFGTVDVGVTVFDFWGSGVYTWKTKVWRAKGQLAEELG